MPARTRSTLVGLTLATAALLGGCGGGGGGGYGGDFEAGFLRTCEAATDDDTAVCQCTYDKLEQTVPFERAERLDRRLQDDPDSPLPDDVAELISTCVAGSVPPSIVTTTTSTTLAEGATTSTAPGGTTTTVEGGTTTTAAEAG
jgi:hypothetical protein